MDGLGDRRIELGGFETRMLHLEPGGDRDHTLVLLHGYSDSADTWRPLMRLLEEDGRGVMAPDMPGFGEADRLARDVPILPQLDRFARSAIELAAETSPTGQVVVAGNSLGGCVALRAAQRTGLPLAGIVPIAPAGLDLARWISIVEGAWAIQAILRSPLPMPERVIRELVGRAYRQLAADQGSRLEAEVVSNFTRTFATKRDVVRMLGTARTLRPEIQAPFELGWIECPVLVIWGERDRMVSAKGAERILAEVEGARAEIIPDCGHCPQVEVPNVVHGLLGEFTQAALRNAA
jgi:pimeloyl-ACP methyl ester carboxylesterase